MEMSQRKWRETKVFKEIAEYFLNLIKELNVYIQESHQILRINIERPKHRYRIVNVEKQRQRKS